MPRRRDVTALYTDLFPLAIAQALHALTFGAAHLGAMQLLTRTAPAALAATAQGLYAAISGGLFMGLAAVLSGHLFETGALHTFGAMAVLSALALLGLTLLARADPSARANEI